VTRPTSTFSKISRSVSKLGSGRRRRAAADTAGASEASLVPMSENTAADEGDAEAASMPSNPRAPGLVRAQPFEPPGRGGALALGQAFVAKIPAMLALEGEAEAARATLRRAEASAADLARHAAAAADVAALGDRAAARGAPAAPPPPDEAVELWERALDACDAAVQEERLGEALRLVHKLERLAARAEPPAVGAASADGAPIQQAAWRMQGEAAMRRERAAAAAERLLAAPAADEAAHRAALRLLAEAGGARRALDAALAASSARLAAERAVLGRPAPGADGAARAAAAIELAAHIGQQLALGVDAAHARAEACLAAAGSAELGAVLASWSLAEAGAACEALTRATLTPGAAPLALPAIAACLQAFLAHCDALDAARGLPTAAWCLRRLWPAAEPALALAASQLGAESGAAAAAEARSAAAGAASLPPAEDAAWAQLLAAFPSAGALLQGVGGWATALAALPAPETTATLQRAVAQAYEAYTSALAAALLGDAAGARSGQVAEAALELCARLVERALPEALAPAGDRWGPMCHAPPLLASLDAMAGALGMAAEPAGQ
jgi:hypothetical protein